MIVDFYNIPPSANLNIGEPSAQMLRKHRANYSLLPFLLSDFIANRKQRRAGEF